LFIGRSDLPLWRWLAGHKKYRAQARYFLFRTTMNGASVVSTASKGRIGSPRALSRAMGASLQTADREWFMRAILRPVRLWQNSAMGNLYLYLAPGSKQSVIGKPQSA